MSACSRCGAPFHCANVDGGSSAPAGADDPAGRPPCWCAAMPVLPRAALTVTTEGKLAGCLCPACLAGALQASAGGDAAASP